MKKHFRLSIEVVRSRSGGQIAQQIIAKGARRYDGNAPEWLRKMFGVAGDQKISLGGKSAGNKFLITRIDKLWVYSTFRINRGTWRITDAVFD